MASATQDELVRTLEQCPLCGCSDCPVVYEETIKPLPAHPVLDRYKGRKMPLRRCGDCGFAFCAELPPAEYFVAYYQRPNYDWELYSKIHGKFLIHPHIVRWTTAFAPGQRVLDIGCSSGLLLQDFPPDYTRVGLELDEHASAAARKLGLEVHQTLVSEFKTDQKFDIVTLIDVLEHLPDPQRVIEQVRDLLVDGGVFYIKVPAFLGQYHKQNLLRALKLSREGIMGAYTHINLFTKKSLRLAVERAGFETLRQGYTTAEIWRLSNARGPLDWLRKAFSNVVKVASNDGLASFSYLTGVDIGLNHYIVARKKPTGG